MPLKLCWCCWPRRKSSKQSNPLEESLVPTCGAGVASSNPDGSTAPVSPQLQSSGMSTQRLLAQVISSSCPNLHLLEQQQDSLSVQQDKQHSKSVHAKPTNGAARPPGSPDIQRSHSSHNGSSQTGTKKTQQQQQQQAIELKLAQANPFLGVEHMTAERSFVKARPGA